MDSPVSDEVDGAQAPRLCDLDDGLADGAVGPVLDDPLARLELGEIGQKPQRGRRVDHERGSGEGAEGRL